MKKERFERAIDSIFEDLAAIEHERWSHWQSYVHSMGTIQSDGSLVIPAELVQRWSRQIATKYVDLSEEEKKSDRDQVRRYLPAISDALLSKDHGERKG